MDYIKENKTSWNKSYEKGWGNKYVDTDLVSLYFHYIKPNLKFSEKTKLKCLDFGCSLGANTKFFAEQGFEVYGIDISDIAIKNCVKINNFDITHFKACNLLECGDLSEIFNIKFDLIIVSNVLYYFSKQDVKVILNHFKNALCIGGIIYANWVTYNHDMYRDYKGKEKSGMISVGESGSVKENLHVYCIEDKEEMLQNMSMFNLLSIKRSVLELQGENEMIHYIGTKE